MKTEIIQCTACSLSFVADTFSLHNSGVRECDECNNEKSPQVPGSTSWDEDIARQIRELHARRDALKAELEQIEKKHAMLVAAQRTKQR